MLFQIMFQYNIIDEMGAHTTRCVENTLCLARPAPLTGLCNVTSVGGVAKVASGDSCSNASSGPLHQAQDSEPV